MGSFLSDKWRKNLDLAILNDLWEEASYAMKTADPQVEAVLERAQIWQNMLENMKDA